MGNETVFSKLEGYAEVIAAKKASRRYGSDMHHQGVLASKLVERLHPKKIDLRLSLITTEMKDVKTFRLVSASGHLPPFEAGQYINLSVNIDGIITSRPYSMSSPPSQTSCYEVTVKREENGFVSNFMLDRLKEGDALVSTGPAGEFRYNPLFHGEDLVMIAGGSGITPMMSMIREFTNRGSQKKIHLIYSSRTPSDVIFNEELTSLDTQYPNFTFTSVITRPEQGYEGITGRVSPAMLKELLGDLTPKTFYVCGPGTLCDDVRAHLLSLGVRPGRVRREIFNKPADVTKLAGWPERDERATTVKVKLSDGRAFEAPVGEPLLNSLDRAGITVPSSCHSGDCSLCRVRLVSGKVFQLPGTRLRISDEQFGYIHSCSAYPTEDIEIET